MYLSLERRTSAGFNAGIDKGLTVSFKGIVSLSCFFFAGVDDADGAEEEDELVDDASSVITDSIEVEEAVGDVESDDKASGGALLGETFSLSSFPSFEPKKPFNLSIRLFRRIVR